MNKIDFKKDHIPFTQVANLVLCDPNLSFKAKGIYSYLFSKPEGWDFASNRISKESKDGRDSVRSGIHELVANGYLTLQKLPSGRTLYIAHTPKTEKPSLAIKKPKTEKAKDGKPQRGKTRPISNNIKEVIKSLNNNIYESKKKPEKCDDSVFVWSKYLEAMHEHSQRHVSVIAYFFEKKGISFDSKEEAQVAIKRHLRDARDVAKFSDEKISEITTQLLKEFPAFTIGTIMKRLSNPEPRRRN